MRQVLLSIGLVFLGYFSQAQTQKVTIYCHISLMINGPKIDYYGVEAFLPDSIKEKVLINYKDQYHFRNADVDKIILMMSANGWKFISFPQTSTTDYILSREILMDEPTRRLYLKKIGDTFKSAH